MEPSPENIEDWASIVPILALFQAAQFHVSMYFRVRDNSDCKAFPQKFNSRMEEKGVQSSFSTTCCFFVTLLIMASQPNLPLRGFQQNSARLVPGLLIFLVLEMDWNALQSIGFSAIADQAKVSDTVLLESKWRSIKREIQTSPQTIIVNKIQKIDPTLARFNCKCSKVSEEKCFFALKAGLCHKKNTQQNESSFYHKTSCVKAVKTLQPFSSLQS